MAIRPCVMAVPLLAVVACGGTHMQSMDSSSVHGAGPPSTSSVLANAPTRSSADSAPSSSPAVRTYSTNDVVARAAACSVAVQAAGGPHGAPSNVADTCRDAGSAADVACTQGDKESCAIAKSVHGFAAVMPLLQQVQAARSCAASSVRECEALCDLGDLDACVEVGSMYTEGRRVRRDLGQGVSVLGSACDRGSMRACYTRGASLMVLDSGAAAPSLQTSCESDVAPWNDVSCAMLVTMLDRGSYKPNDAEKRALLIKLCEREQSGAHTHGNTNACGRLQDTSSGQAGVF